MQIWKITAVLVTLWLTPSLHARYIGEQFAESVFGKASPDHKVNLTGEKEHWKYYQITFPSEPSVEIRIDVNKHTGKICYISFMGSLHSLYEAIAFAASICEGDVKMPLVYEYGEYAEKKSGFRLESTPGKKYEGAKFDMWASPASLTKGDAWTLNVMCMEYVMEHNK